MRGYLNDHLKQVSKSGKQEIGWGDEKPGNAEILTLPEQDGKPFKYFEQMNYIICFINNITLIKKNVWHLLLVTSVMEPNAHAMRKHRPQGDALSEVPVKQL